MDIKYKNSCELLSDGPTVWLSGSLDTCPGGFFVTNSDGTVLSVQPDGTVDSRPSGTTPGPFEICQTDSNVNVLKFNPIGRFNNTAGIVYSLAYRGQ